VYAFNETIMLKLLFIEDVGNSVIVHMFGAYFGLAASFFFYRAKAVYHK
jgi:hypothetical protein